MLSSHDRYHRDPLFKMIVDMLVAQLNHAEFTPTELREAVIVAACIHEQTNCRRVVLTEQEMELIRVEPIVMNETPKYPGCARR